MITPESIRQWYRRTTRTALLALAWSAALAGVLSIVAFLFMPQDHVTKIQTFNGAFTVPVFGGIWIASFIFLWLNPSREVMFRSQEAMERMEEKIETRLARLDRVIIYLEKAVDSDILGKIEKNITAIKDAVEERTKTLPTIPRRSIDPPPFMPAHELPKISTEPQGVTNHLNGD